MAYCEWREHQAEKVTSVIIHDDGVNPVVRANYCDGCIIEQQNDFLDSANDIYSCEAEFLSCG